MTKYLTTFNELKCHIDKKVKINWYNFETKRFENEIGFLEKYKFERYYFIKCNNFKFAGIIPSCVNSIELIEEDNQEELKNKFPDEAWILEEKPQSDKIKETQELKRIIELRDLEIQSLKDLLKIKQEEINTLQSRLIQKEMEK